VELVSGFSWPEADAWSKYQKGAKSEREQMALRWPDHVNSNSVDK